MALLDGKVAVVTGAGGGLGRDQALLFAREGARLVCNDLGCSADGTGSAREPADETVRQVRELGGQALASYDSIATPEGAEAVVELARATWGRLDVVVNDAGIVRDRTLLKMDDETFDDVVHNDLRGAFLLTRAAARAMVAAGEGGSIIHASAAAGLYGHISQANFAAANAGIWALARTAAIELKKQRVRVNVIVPLARTRLTETLPMFRTVGVQTMGPAFVSPVALFLASDLAAEVTGEAIGVAGGRLYVFKVRESNGAFLERPWTAEEIRDGWAAITKQ